MNNPIEETKLLPCPFCGCLPIPYDGDTKMVHTPSCYLINEHSWLIGGSRKLKDWNTRTPAPLPEPSKMKNAEELGRLVRQVWIEWAKEQLYPKPTWLTPWNLLNEPDKDVDRRIGLAVQADALASVHPSQPSLNIEKAAEELYQRVAIIFSHGIKEEIKQILTRHLTEVHPSQPSSKCKVDVLSSSACNLGTCSCSVNHVTQPTETECPSCGGTGDERLEESSGACEQCQGAGKVKIASQPTDEQIEEIVEKQVKPIELELYAHAISPPWFKAQLKQAILTALALRTTL